MEEWCFFKIIEGWLTRNPDFQGTKEIGKIFAYVHFELLRGEEIRYFRSQLCRVTEGVLLTSLDRASGTLGLQRPPGLENPGTMDWSGSYSLDNG